MLDTVKTVNSKILYLISLLLSLFIELHSTTCLRSLGSSMGPFELLHVGK